MHALRVVPLGCLHRLWSQSIRRRAPLRVPCLGRRTSSTQSRSRGSCSTRMNPSSSHAHRFSSSQTRKLSPRIFEISSTPCRTTAWAQIDSQIIQIILIPQLSRVGLDCLLHNGMSMQRKLVRSFNIGGEKMGILDLSAFTPLEHTFSRSFDRSVNMKRKHPC